MRSTSNNNNNNNTNINNNSNNSNSNDNSNPNTTTGYLSIFSKENIACYIITWLQITILFYTILLQLQNIYNIDKAATHPSTQLIKD